MDLRTNIKNNQELRIFYELELDRAWEDYYKGKSYREEVMELDWFYYENWVEPIIEMGPHGFIYLN